MCFANNHHTHCGAGMQAPKDASQWKGKAIRQRFKLTCAFVREVHTMHAESYIFLKINDGNAVVERARAME